MAFPPDRTVYPDPWPKRRECEHPYTIHYGNGFLVCNDCGARGMGDRDDGMNPVWEDGKPTPSARDEALEEAAGISQQVGRECAHDGKWEQGVIWGTQEAANRIRARKGGGR